MPCVLVSAGVTQAAGERVREGMQPCMGGGDWDWLPEGAGTGGPRGCRAKRSMIGLCHGVRFTLPRSDGSEIVDESTAEENRHVDRILPAPSIFWSPCAPQWIRLCFEDLRFAFGTAGGGQKLQVRLRQALHRHGAWLSEDWPSGCAATACASIFQCLSDLSQVHTHHCSSSLVYTSHSS